MHVHARVPTLVLRIPACKNVSNKCAPTGIDRSIMSDVRIMFATLHDWANTDLYDAPHT